MTSTDSRGRRTGATRTPTTWETIRAIIADFTGGPVLGDAAKVLQLIGLLVAVAVVIAILSGPARDLMAYLRRTASPWYPLGAAAVLGLTVDQVRRRAKRRLPPS
jgi:hypothetical protein